MPYIPGFSRAGVGVKMSLFGPHGQFFAPGNPFRSGGQWAAPAGNFLPPQASEIGQKGLNPHFTFLKSGCNETHVQL